MVVPAPLSLVCQLSCVGILTDVPNLETPFFVTALLLGSFTNSVVIYFQLFTLHQFINFLNVVLPNLSKFNFRKHFI